MQNQMIPATLQQHRNLSLMVNENCAVPIPEPVLQQFFKPHRLTYYCFTYMHQGSADFEANGKKHTITDGQLAFGLPGQVVTHFPGHKGDQHFKISFDEQALVLLPGAFPFLFNPHQVNTISFGKEAGLRVRAVCAVLFRLLYASAQLADTAVILAHLNALLTELNSAYFTQYGYTYALPGIKQTKFQAFKALVDAQLTLQPSVKAIAQELAMSTSQLYTIVKEFSGLSPKEWITSRLMLEAQRKLQYSPLSVKEVAYELGFNDPDYFSRLFKKNRGIKVSEYISNVRDLSGR